MPDYTEKTMDEFDHWVIPIAKMVVCFVLLWLYLMGLALWISPTPLPQRFRFPELTESEKNWINGRYAYHGDKIRPYRTPEGFFFDRNGKRCRL